MTTTIEDEVEDLLRAFSANAATPGMPGSTDDPAAVRRERWGAGIKRIYAAERGSSVDVWYGGPRGWAVVVLKRPQATTCVYTSVRMALAGMAGMSGMSGMSTS